MALEKLWVLLNPLAERKEIYFKKKNEKNRPFILCGGNESLVWT